MIVKLQSLYQNKHLSFEKQYQVIGIEGDYYRLLDESGNPTLFPPDLFDVIDSNMPPDWITKFDESGGRYSYHEPLNEVGFFEDYFDGVPLAREVFEKYVDAHKIKK